MDIPEFRDLDPENENKKWWVDYLKTGIIHSFSGDETVEECLKNDTFDNPVREDGNQIWDIRDIDVRGPLFFSFDLVTIYEFFRDYDKLTPEQKTIFDREYPAFAEMRN